MVVIRQPRDSLGSGRSRIKAVSSPLLCVRRSLGLTHTGNPDLGLFVHSTSPSQPREEHHVPVNELLTQVGSGRLSMSRVVVDRVSTSCRRTVLVVAVS